MIYLQVSVDFFDIDFYFVIKCFTLEAWGLKIILNPFSSKYLLNLTS